MQETSGFILILNGPPDADQPKVVKELLKRPGRFHVSTNKIKFLISDYSAEKTDRAMLNQIVFDLAESARMEGDYSLVVDGSVAIQKEWWREYERLADVTQAAFVQVNIEGPYDTLLDRFQRRVTRSEKDGTKISIRTEAEFKERYDAYQSLKNSQLRTFDTLLWEPEAIRQAIEKFLP